ncbi:MAG: hypothetical protein OXC07_03610, partial [Kistimonas sp.]|nr:hypothetical protein [Kistimonas sp.]
APISGPLAVTRDGLSLLLSTAADPPTLLQLGPPEGKATSSQAQPVQTPASEPAPAPEPRQHCCRLL